MLSFSSIFRNLKEPFMNKRSLKNLALSGIVSGLCVVQAANAAATVEKTTAPKTAKTYSYDPNDSNVNYHLMTEEELLVDLDDDGYKQYMSLTPEGKAVAREIASAYCAGTNECKGRNACKTDKNDCAGKGDCKGKSKCGFSDKNLAVKVAAQVMAAKRAEALKK